MCRKLICLAFFALVFMAAPVEAAVEPITSVVVTQVDNPGGAPNFWLESITVGGYTVTVDELVTGTSTGVATAQPAPYDDITVADNFDLNLFAGRANEVPPTHQIKELGGQSTWTDTNGDNPDFFVFETGGNQDINIEAILPGGTIGQTVSVPTATWGNTDLSISGTGTSHDGQSISGVSFAITDLLDQSGNNLTNSDVIEGIQITSPGYDPSCFCAIAPVEPAVTITVEAGGDIAAANALAKAGDTIEIAAGTYYLTSQIEIKDGVTYRGAGPGLTIIDGNDTTRAFVAWGDRSFNEGNENPNDSGPKGWVLEGMTIQNCVADTNNRFSYAGAAFDMLDVFADNDADASGGLNPEEADADAGAIRLPGEDGAEGTEDDDLHRFAAMDADGNGELSEAELNAQLLSADDEFGDENGDGGAITIGNEAVGTIANCDFLNNHTPIPGDGDDGGAVNIAGLSVVTINDCLFNGNYACSPTGVSESDETGDADGDGSHIKVQGGSASAITPGTTLIANHCVFLNGRAEDDGGAIQSSAVGSIIRLDACWFEGNTAADDGTVLFIGNESSGELTVTNCVFANNISTAASDRMCQVRRNSKFINCTFVGNNQDDQDLIYNNANTADTDADGTDDEMADATQVVNCIFANNVVGNGDDVLGSRNNDFTIAATNCIFFGNTLQNGNAADNTQRPDVETSSVLTDPLLDANYVPGADSEAIDGGVDPATVGVTLTTDYNGDARPQGAAYDIGAYEIAAGPTNLVQNGSFDDASAWVIIEHTVPAVTNIDLTYADDAPSKGEAPCLRVSADGVAVSRPLIYQKLTLTAGATYQVTAAIKIVNFYGPASYPPGPWFQIYMNDVEPDPPADATFDWNPSTKLLNIMPWNDCFIGNSYEETIGADGLMEELSGCSDIGDNTGLYIPPGDRGTEVDIWLVIKPGMWASSDVAGGYDVLFDNVGVYPVKVVDDFESYNDLDPTDPESNRIFNVWLDGLDNPTNGSLVGYDNPPFAEQTIVHGGNQSMPLYYDNSVGYSEATLTLTYPRNWTENGVTMLTIWFRGDSANAAETLYVALNGSAVVNHDNPDAAQITTWTQWNIDLQAFANQGVNLTNVNSISLGLGNKNNPLAGGSGTMYFDDIRLYQPATEPEPAP